MAEYDNPEIEHGIFSLVITWVQSLSSSGIPEAVAREKVAAYLEELQLALRETQEEKVN